MNKDPEATGDGARDRSTDFVNPLPGDERVWKDCSLAPAIEWSDKLRASALTIASFAYPAAVFWGEELLLLHNEAWATDGGLNEQAKKQRGRLAPDAWKALTASLRGGRPTRIESRHLLRGQPTATERYTVLVSPLFDDEDKERVVGLLVQLTPASSLYDGSKEEHAETRHNHDLDAQEDRAFDISKLGEAIDNVPLDEHPFFHRFAEMLPSGLAILDHKAQAIFVNQHFYELTTHLSNDQSFKSWPQSIHPEDYERVMSAYLEAFNSQKQLRTEFRAQGERYPWRLLLLTPLGDENLQHVSLREYGGFICSVVDISSQKSAEIAQQRDAKEARERKNQQERFIDMISHEIRNPLSAILHCTEDIEEATRHGEDNVDLSAIREAVETINLCIDHQRNIVDDVLSFSKLDSSMLSLTPKACEPSKQLANSLKMFQPELRKQGLQFEYCLDNSYVDYDVSWVMADLARIGQVLVNLVTNAIKFTVRSEGEKKLTVSIGASHERPTSYPPSVVFFNSDELAFRVDATNTLEWGNGEALFIVVAVKDTGIGISEEGQARLFERFRQATPKTEEIYGGSGLGLNISRKLCQLHGGEIGVASEEGSGSTFGFFFKVKRSDKASDDLYRTQEEQIEQDEVKDEIERLGNASPREMDSKHIPESLRTPPVRKVDGVNLLPPGPHDSRYRQTAEVASQIKGLAADPYANAQRPKISRERKTGEHMQSGDVTTTSYFDQQQLHERPARPGAPLARKHARQHVLLVEDNIINQRIVFRKLETHGFNVTTANNGREAVDAVLNSLKPSTGEKAAFDVVLMDQEMPIMDGNSATKEIRRMEGQGAVEHIPILGVTANVRAAQQNAMIESGMDDVISKPYKINDIVEKISKITGSHP